MLNSNQALLIRAIPSVLFHGHLQNYTEISAGRYFVQLSVEYLQGR